MIDRLLVHDLSPVRRSPRASGFLKEAPPAFVGLTPTLRFHLDPVGAVAGAVGRVDALAHDAFQLALLALGEQAKWIDEASPVEGLLMATAVPTMTSSAS